MTRKKTDKQTTPRKSHQRLVFEELEPRLLLSADLPVDIPAMLAPDRGDDEPIAVHEEITTTAVTGEQHAAHELVFVDTDTPDYQTLIDDLLGNSGEDRLIEVVLLDNSSDGIAQITDTLSQYNELDAVHLISHGSEGAIDLGATRLEFDTLLTNSTAIQGWADAFSENGDLLIYGCNLAASEDGQALVESLARLTGADVAASEDLTGSDKLGGDWDLEYVVGDIEAGGAISTDLQQEWAHLMVLENARDEFNTAGSFSGNDGTQNWTGDWQELGESNGPSSGNVRVVSSPAALQIGGNGMITGDGALREIDLSQASSATLTFDAWRSASRAATITLAVSDNGGTDWTNRQTWSFSSLTSSPSLKTFDISAFASANTQIRFLGAGEADSAFFYADNIQIEYQTNAAPVLSGANDLAAIDEDPISNGGTLASALLAGHVSDADTGSLEGIAVIGVDNTSGMWEYSINGGGAWLAFGSPGTTSARLLAADANTYVRFVPGANWNGTVTNGLTFHAWDQTSSPNGGTDDLSGNTGGSTPYSTATASSSITVNPVNDDPTNAGTLPTDLVFLQDTQGKLDLSTTDLSDVDANGGSLTLTITSDSGHLQTLGGVGLTLGGSQSQLILTGSLTDLNNFLNDVNAIDYEHATPGIYGNDVDLITIEISDNGNTGSGGGGTIMLGTINIDIDPVAPQIDLDADNSTATGINFTTTWTQGGGQIKIADTDATVTDADNVTLLSMTVTLTNHLDGADERLVADTSGTGISVSYANGPGEYYVYLTGADTLANYEQVLKSIVYDNTAASPDATTRSVTVEASDGTNVSSVATTTINMATSNSAPVITSNGGGATANISVGENTTAATTVTATDVDGDQIEYTITGGADAALFDIDRNTGVLTFKSAPDYEAPADANVDNVYEVEVTADDQISTPDSQLISVTVTAANEPPTFDVGDGIVTTDIGSTDNIGNGITIQSDGKIIVSGRSFNGSDYDVALVRYNTDGSLDNTFGVGGKLVTDFAGGDDQSFSVTMQTDGKILTAGYSYNGTNYDFALVRYNTDGSLDNTFGVGGMLTTAIGATADIGYSVTVQSDGKILVAGYSVDGLDKDFALVRYDSDGTLDTSFSVDGKLTTDFGSNEDIGYSVTVQTDGKILVAGESKNGSFSDFALARYNSDGSLDNTFGVGGMLTTAIGSGPEIGQSVTVQPDGKILVAGRSYNGSDLDFALVRYNSDGSLDTSFNGDGMLTTDFGSGIDVGFSVTLQTDGKILVAGYSSNGANTDFSLARYNSDGSLDTSFDGDGKLTTAIGSGDDAGLNVILQPDGKILVAGQTDNGSNLDIGLVRYNTDGSLDLTFDPVNTLDGNPTFTEGGAPVVLDADVEVYDQELTEADNFDGASLTLVRNGGADAEDLFSATGTLAALTEGANLVVGGTTIGTVTTNSAGTLLLTFNASATNTLVNQAMQQIAYSNSSGMPPASVQIDWTFDDGNTGDQGTGGALQAIGSTTVTIIATNEAPTFFDGAVGSWSFNEGSGDSVAEGAVGISTATLGSTTGADANDPTWTSGIFGQALQFDGVNDYVEIADAPGIDISGPEFSASLWVKPDRGPGTEDMFFMKGDRQGIGNVNYYLSWKDTGKMTWAFKSDGGFEYIDMDVTLPTVDQWNHVAVVFDRPTVSIYINGTEYTSSVGTGGTSMDKDLVANDEPLWIGAGRDGGSIVTPGNFSAPFSGAIDELALFDRALTDAEVEAIRTSAPPVVTASSFSIDENSANNTVVGTVAANDPDVGDTLTYAITAGNTNGAFAIDNNGVITVANGVALDFETTPVFNLTVEATDDGSPSLSDTTIVTISLNNLSDAPSLVNNAGLTAAEGSTTVITSAELGYADSEQPASSIMYMVTTSPANGQLELTTNSDVAISSFTQAQVDAGEVVYIHDGGETTADSFGFTVDDGQGNYASGPSIVGIGTLTNVTSGISNAMAPDYSPDGSQVVFSRNNDIYIMDADGSNQTPLVTAIGGDFQAVWSPDGSKIAFTSNRDGNNEIYVIDADGSNETRITIDGASDSAPAWSPDSSKIAFTSDRDGDKEIWVMDANGTNLVQLTSNTAIDGGASWSPDGSKIVFQSTRDGNYEIYVMDADGSNQTRLTNDAGLDAIGDWSPDGSKILFYSDRDGNNEIYVMDADGSNQVRLTNDAGDDIEAEWSPDGSSILFSSDRDGDYDVYSANVIYENTFAITVTAANDAPTFTALDGNPTFIESGTPVVLDSDVTIFDAELSTADNFAGATLTLERNGAANSDDVFSATGTLGALTESGNLVVGGTTIGTVTINSGGTLILMFNSSATTALVNQAMQQIAYSNTNNAPPASLQIDWTFDDGNSGVQGTGGALQALGSTTVNITAVNDAPTLVNNSGAMLAQGGTETINSTELHYDDPEQPASSVTYTVTTTPSNGQLELTTNAGVAINSFTQAQIDAGQVVYVHDGSSTTTDSFNFDVTDGIGGTLSAQTFALTIIADSGQSLWITAEQDVPAPSGWNGIDSEAVAASELLALGGANLAFEPGTGTTDGTFSRMVDFDPMVVAGSSRVNALHVVGSNLTVGSNAISLEAGDVLFSLMETGTHTLQNSDLTTLDVQRNDIVIFRPDSPGNYSSGTYSILLDGSDLGLNALGAFTLVEQATTVGQGGGASALDAGDILFVDWNDVAADAHIQRLQPGTLGDNTTGTLSVLVDGNDLSSDFTLGDIVGLDLVEQDTAIGGTLLQSGQILLTLYGGDDIGGTTITGQDIVVLDVTTTGANSAATAALLFEGTDVGLDTWQEDIRGLSLSALITVNPVNDAPVATADSFTVNEGSTTNLNLATNDSDADDGLDLTSITVVSGPTNGSIVVNADGTVDYTHDGSETVADSFTYTIDDLSGVTSNTVTVNLTVTPVNDAPIAVAESFTVNEGSTTNLNLATNDTDADDGLDLSSIIIVSGPTNGSIVVNADGTVDYTHDGSETVADSFTYTIDDLATATSNTVTVSLTVTPVNDAPIAVADSYTVNEGSTTNLNLAANDTDADDGLDLSSIIIVSGPTNGSIAVNADGTVDYTHDGSETVADSFTYTIDDLAGAASNTVTVNLTITPVNDAPVATADSFTVNEGSTTNLALAANDTDADDGLDLASIAIFSGPTNGSIVVNADGTVDYTHDGSETVADSFTYTIDDLTGATSNTVTVNLAVTPVNDAPVAVADSFTVNEGSTTNLNLATNDSDADDGLDLSSITIVSGPTNGSIVVNANGTVDYTHDGSETVADSFTYAIDDLAGATSNTVTVNLTVTPVNDAPVATADSFTVNEGSTTNLSLATNDSDADDGLDLTSITVVSGPANGSLVVNADGTVDYTHDGSETVADSFTYTIDDLAGATSNTVMVSLTVTPVNDAPVAVADSFTVNEGSTTNLNLAANDTDADDGLDLASITIVSGPTNGSIVVNADGTVDYTHDGSETVADSFTYTIDDLSGLTSNTVTVNLTVTPVNDAPVAVADSFTVNEGSTTNLNLAVNDSDADDGLDLASITIVSGPTNGSILVNADGTIDYTHDGSETVADSFTYTIDDLAGATSNTVTVSLTVTPVNDAPVAVADSFTVNEGSTTNLALATNDSDADDGLDLASITIVSGPANGSIVVNANGTVDYTHDGSETLADSFTYTIDDLAGATSNTVTVSLIVTAVNDAPIAVADSFTVNEGSTTNLNLATNDSDTDDGLDLASITIVSGPTNGSIAVNADGTVDYTHDGSETVADSFTYTIDDLAGATSNTVTVNVTVTSVNDAPVAVADSFTVNEDSTTNLNLATNDSDADDGLDLTSIAIVGGPSNGSIVVNADGTVDYTHDGSETVADSFIYTIDDLSGVTSNTVTVNLTVTPVNDAPVAVADSFTVNEGSTTNLNLATNDSDADDGLDLTSITIVSGPTNGSIVVNADGTVDYTHDGSETVADSFTYAIDDLAGATSNTVTVNLTVTPVNDAPVATADSFTVNEGSTTNLSLATNDSDADDGLDLTSITVVSGPANGSLVVNADGTVDYTHDGSETVADSFTYTIDDLAGATSNTVMVSLTVTPVNDAPVAVADSFTVNEGSTTNLNLAANDTDADDGLDLASITIVSGPTNGSIVVNADGTVDYTHDGSETVADSFTYAIDDLAGATSNTVTVNLTVTPVNDAPVATADSFTVNEGSTTNLSLATNDSDADDGLDLTSITVVSGPANGSLVVNADGTVDYTHDGSETVADSFTYTIDDLAGATSNTVAVNLTVTPVNDAPVATADSFTVNEGSTTNLSLATNDSDADDGLDLTSITVVSGPANGSLVVNADGTVDYTHDGSETVADSFTYTIDDLAGATSNTVTVSLTVTPVNDAPVAVADSFTVNEGSTTNLALATNDSDADDGLDLASITIVSGPANGSIVVNANGTVDYTHDGSETLADSFTYTIDDLAGATSNTVTVSLIVTAVNDAPIAVADSFTVNEGSTTNLNLATNDSDTDDGLDLASITIVSGPTNGSIAVNADGTVDYTHDGSETVADSFTYTIDDLAGATSNTVTVNVTVTSVNDAPVAVADSFTVNEDSTTNLNLATNDSDADDGLDLTSIAIVGGPSNGSIVVNADGTVDYTHDGSETVADSFIYTIDDLSGVTSNTVTVNLTVTPVNDAPVAVADSFTVNEGSTTNLNLATNDSDADDGLDLTSITIVSGPTNGSIVVNADGTVDYTHDGSETVADSFTYTIDDLAGATSNTVAVNLTVTPVNDAPVATADSFTVNEGSTTNLSLATNDSDADDGLDLTSITVVSGPANGSLVVNADGTVDYTHDGSETVADSFTYTIDDLAGATSNTVAVNLTVTPVNDAPVAVADSFTVNEGSTTNLNLAANDTDADDGLDLASITIVSGPTNGSIVVNADGTVDYTHDGSETVADSFTYAIDDLAGATSNTVTVNLTVTPVNDAPVATADSFTVNEGSTTNLSLATNDTDADDGLDLTSITIVSGPTNGSIVVNADGTVDYTHDGSETVADSFTYTIDDLAGATSNTVAVNLTVTPVNDAPVATADSFTVNEGSTTNLSLATNDSDADDGLDLTSITVVSGPANGSLVVNADGTVDYTHDGSETVADSFTYTIDDLAGATSNTVMMSLTVTPVNDAPVAVADSFTVNEGSTTNLNLATNDADADDGLDLASITIVSGPTNGSIVVNADGTVDYTHDGSETVADSFTYTIDDLAGAMSNTVTVSLAVTPVNDVPVATADSFTVNEGSTTNLNLATNDSDTDDGLDLASITIVSGPTNGSIAVNADGTVDYTHDGSETVADSFTYTIDDLSGLTSNTVTVNLTVTPVNDAPVAVADSFTVNEGSTTNLNLAVNDSDADDGLDLASITIVSGPTNGSILVNADGTVDYTHDGSETVADSFTYTIDDLATATSNTVTVSLTVTPVNDAPVAVADSFTVNEGSTTNLALATNDTDADDGLDLTSITIVSGPTNGSIVVNADGTVDYTHDGSETAADSFTYTIDDLAGAASNTVTVSLTVTPVNDAPIATADSFTVNEGSTTNLNLVANDTDADDGLDLASITIVSGPTNGSIVVNADGTVDYAHDGSETVADSFTYTIDDLSGVTSNTVTVSLTVTPVNDAPVAVADSFTVNESSTTNLNLATNDTDADDGLDLTSITIVSGPTNGSLVVNANGTVDYTHDGSETVADSFTYTIDDLAGATSNTVTVSLTVTPVNDAPVATADSFTVNEGSTTNLNLATNDTDTDDGLDLSSITIVSGPTNGSIVVNADGTVDYTHDGSETVSDSFTYTIDDLATATSNTVTVSLTITPVNNAPVAVADSFTVNEGSTTNLNLATNDTDADDGLDLSSITIVSGTVNGSVVVNADGTVDYTHNGSETVADSFTYTINDASGAASNVGTVNLTIDPVNDAPIHSVPAAQSTSGNTPLSFSNTNGNSITVADPDASGAPMEVTLSVSNGSLSLAGTTGLSFSSGDGSSDATMTFTGTAADINTALNGLSFQADAGFEGMAMVQIITDDLGNVGTGGALNALDRVYITVTASAPAGSSQDTLPPLDELIEEIFDIPAPEPETAPVNRVNVNPAAEEATEAATPASGSDTTDPTSDAAVDAMLGSGQGVPTQADVSLPGSVQLFDQNLQPHDDDRPSSVRLIGHVIRQGLVDPFTYAKMLNPLQPDMAIWESIDAMMEQMDGRDGSWYSDDQVLTTTTATGLTVSFTVGYVSWLLRAGYLSASLMSVMPLWREFDPLPVLAATTGKKKGKSADDGKDSPQTNDIESEKLFTSNETV